MARIRRRNFIGQDTLYVMELYVNIFNLHFETCHYQAIDFNPASYSW